MSPIWVRRLSLLNVIVNVLIVITGGAVRLTGSGLGCSSWPNCEPGQFHATAEMGIHANIEWGNRLFGVVVGIVAAATLLAAIYRKPRRRSLIVLSGLVATGVPAQAIIGMITVETGLNPWSVSTHFLVTIAVLAAAFAVWVRAGEPDGPAEPVVPNAFRWLIWTLTGTALAAIVIGVLVTGSGPHAGDPTAPRIPIDSALLAQFHADAVFLLIGLTVATVFAAAALGAPTRLRRAAYLLLAVELAQGLIGFVQFFTGLPELLVGAHMLGAALLWLAALWLGFATRVRVPRAQPTGDGSAMAPAPSAPAAPLAMAD